MKLHYMGKYNLDPDSLPHGDHMPGAVQFKEAGSSGELGVLANVLCIVIMVILVALSLICGRFDFSFKSDWRKISEACLVFLITLFPHELLHAVCFRRDVYLYTNLMQGMLFVVGPETMSKSRFIFMSLLPNLVFGLIPYLAGMIFPDLMMLLMVGILGIGAGAGDYYNVFNAVTQMPRGARTYLYKFHSYWYMPEGGKE